MSVTLNFDANGVKPLANNEPVPEGNYLVHIVESEAKPTNAGDGSYLALTYEILEGDYAGRKLFDNLNIGNKNPAAVEIAYRKLSSICHATGVIQVGDSAQLHNRPFGVRVKLRPAETAEQSKDGKPHDSSNEIKGYMDANEVGKAAASAPATSTPPPTAAPAAAPAFGAPPAFVAPAAAATTRPAASAPTSFVAPAAAAPAVGGAPLPPWAKPA